MLKDVTPLTKLQVAKRQLETAATLWFDEGDSVSIHTLVAASHTIVHDVAAHRGSGAFMLSDQFISELGYDTKVFKKEVRRAERFFKHADKDPDDVLTFSREDTEVIFSSAIDCYHKLVPEKSPLLALALARIHFLHPETLSDAIRAGIPSTLHNIAKLSQREFYRQFHDYDFVGLLYPAKG